MPIYSGGLGILAGDHLKSASDLGIPLVGIGLYYDQGYFRQRLGSRRLAARGLHRRRHARSCRCSRRRGDGQPVTVEIETAHRHDRGARSGRPRRPQHAAAARLQRRGQPPGGSRADRAALRRRRPRPDPPGAAAGRRRRAGAGGSGISPGRLHLNEGHSAFAALELIARRMDAEGIGVEEAMRRVARRWSSPPTRRCRPATIASRPSSSRSTSARCATPRAVARRICWPRPRTRQHARRSA